MRPGRRSLRWTGTRGTGSAGLRVNAQCLIQCTMVKQKHESRTKQPPPRFPYSISEFVGVPLITPHTPPPPPGSKFDFKMLKIIVLSSRGFAHGEGSSCCSGPCSSAQEPAARAFTHSMSRTNKTLYRSPHRALSLSLSRHFDQGAQMDRPNTVTTQYMLLFSQRSVALPSVELSQ